MYIQGVTTLIFPFTQHALALPHQIYLSQVIQNLIFLFLKLTEIHQKWQGIY